MVGGCKLKQVGTICMSRDRPTQLECLRELHTQIHQDHDPKCVTAAQPWEAGSSAVASTKRPVDEGPASRNANEVLMLRAKIKTLEEHAVIANKSVLEAKKERDKLHKELDLIEGTDTVTYFKSKENLNFWSERPQHHSE